MGDESLVDTMVRAARSALGRCLALARPILAMLAIAAGLTVIGGTTPVAAVDQPFNARFTTNTTGTVRFVANTLLTCSPSTNCTAAQTGSSGRWANNNFSMVNVHVDGGFGTTNSSSAELVVPTGATVRFAGLYWGAVSNSSQRNQVQLDTPATGGYSYSTVTASTLYSTGQTYQGFADITATVAAAGSGTYTVGDVQARTGTGRHAGWTIVVVLEDPSLPFRNLSVFDGWNQIRSGEVQNIGVSGFLAPPTGPVNAEIGLVAYEGDNRYTGDYAQLNGTALSDATNASTNFFNSTISTGGVVNSGGNPSYADQLGFDANIVQTTGLVNPSSTSATITVASRGDWYYPGVITSAIDIFVPDLVSSLDKSVTDDNGGDVHPGDTLTYDVTFTNTADDAAVAVQLSDTLPAGVTYVPGSLQVVSGDNPGTKTDAVDGDTASITGSTINVNLGTGATASTGGRVAPGAVTDYHVRFKATVNSGTENSTISNTASIAYDGETVGDSYNGSAEATVDVEPLADVRLISKTDDVDPVVAGSAGPVTYTLTVGNFGPSPAANVVVTDTLPSGVTYVDGSSDSRCNETSAGSGTVVCNLGTLAALAPGSTESVAIAATVDETTPVGSLGNRAAVATDTTDKSALDDAADEQTTVTRQADVSVTKAATANPDSGGNAVAGGRIEYLLTVSNAGASSATNVTLSDALPAGTSFESATAGGGGTCSQPGSVVCTWSSIGSGESRTVQLVVKVDPDADAGTVTNRATVSADEDDPTTANNSVAESIGLVREIDLVTTKTNVAAPAPGQDVLYALTVTNNGPSSARNAEVVDTLPSQVTFSAALSSSGCTLTTPPSEVTCSLGTIQPGTTENVTIGAAVPAAVADGTELVNTAVASADEGTSPTAEDRVDAERQVDLSIVKTADSDPVAAGATLTYTLAVANGGPSNSDGATIVDTLPAGVTFVSGAPTDSRCSAAGSTVTCTPINLAAGASDSLTVAVTVSSGIGAGTNLDNTATISAPVGEQDTNTGNNSGTVTTQVVQTSALQVIKTDSVDPVVAGNTMSYTVSVTNHGPSVDDNVVLTDPLPTGVSFVSATGPCSETTAGSNVVTCSFGSLAVAPAVGSSASTTITVEVDRSVSAGTVLVNTATADGDASSPTTGSQRTTVDASSDVSMTKTAPASVNAGGSYSYVLTVTNAGPSNATGVVATDILPPELTAASWSVSGGFGTCSGTPLRCIPGSTAADGNLAVGDSVVFTVNVDSDPAAADGLALVNKATVTATQPDPDLGNNTVSASTVAQRSADLAITKSNPGGATPAGGMISYSVTVDNLGPSQAGGVTITDPIPTGLTFNAGASSSGCSVVGPNVVCNVGTVDPADPVAAYTLTFDVSSSLAATTVMNTATVSATETDPNPANDSASQQTSIYNEADLGLTKTSPTAPAVPGQTYRYDLVVTNRGPSDAANTVITDTLPTGTTLVAASSDSRCSAGAGQTVTCALGNLPPSPAAGHQETVAITVMVGSSVTGALTNSATAVSDTNDPTSSDRTATDTSPVVPRADLSLNKSASPDPVNAGQNVTYTLTVSNAGPSDAPSYTISDTLPTGLTFVATGSSSECSAAGSVITCSEPTALAAGAPSRTYTIVATSGSDLADGTKLVNRATVTSPVDDPDQSNDSGSADVTVNRISDLTINKSTTTASAVAGDDVSFTLTVTNQGPSDATGIMVSDTLPANITPGTVTPSGSVSCSLSAQIISCGGPSLAAGDSFTVTIGGTVKPSTPDNSTPTNTASVDAIETDSNSANNGDTAAVSVSRQSDLRITKTSAAQPMATAGATHLFEIEVANVGLSDDDGVTVTDTLPPNTTFHSTLSSSVCSEPTTGTVSCSVGTLPAGAKANLVVAVTIDGSVSDGASLTNSASVTGVGTDLDATNNSDSVTVDVERTADVSVIKQGPTTPVTAGSQVQFSLTATNAGPSDATGLTVTDTLPTGLTFVAGAPTDPRCSAAGQVVTCTESGPLTATGSTTFVVAAATSGLIAQGATITNQATITASEQDPNDTNNSTSVITEFTRSSDLTVTKTDGADPMVAGERLTYTIVASNGGPSVAANATVTETLPTGATYVDALSDARCDETTSGSGVVTCALGTLGVGSSNAQSLTIVADLVGSLGAGAQLDNAVSLSGDSATTATATEETTINREVDLVTTKTLHTNPVVAGQAVSWTVTVDNNGPSTATDVVLTDILPIGLANVTTSPGGPTCAVDGAALRCTWSEVASGARASVTISAEVESWVTTSTDVTNSASATSAEPDRNSTNNASTAAGSTVRSVDVSVTKTAQNATISAGQAAVWTLTVSNAGPSYASNVVVTDQLPSQVGYDPSGSSPACVETPTGSGTVLCTAATLADDGSQTFTIATTTASTLADQVVLENTASVAVTEPNTATQTSATSSITVGTTADLSLEKTVGADGLRAGLDGGYQLVVTNAGPSQAADVVITDTLPAGLGFVSTGSSDGCTATGQTVTCAVGSLAVGAVQTVSVGVAVAPDASDVITNSAAVSAATVDPDQTDNTTSRSDAVQRSATVELTKTGPSSAVQGQTVEWVVTATNLGPAASSARITDQVPDGLELVSSSAPTGVDCQNVSGQLVCETSQLAVGQGVEVRLETRVTGTGDITNTASVSGAGVTTSASAAATVAVAPNTDLAFTGTSTARLLFVAMSLIGLGVLVVARRPRTASASA